MNQCTLCNPDNVRLRNEAYRLLADNCTLSAVATKLNISYNVLSRCWKEHDNNPIRDAERMLVKAKKRYAKAEAYNRKLTQPQPQARLELNDAQQAVLDLEKHLAELKRQTATDDKGGYMTIEKLDAILRDHIGSNKQAGDAWISLPLRN